MSVYSTLYHKVFWPGYEMLRRRYTHRLLQQGEQRQWASSDTIREFQFKELCRLLHYAFYQCPWYRQRFDTLQIHPSDIKSEKDFRQLPPITKADIRENREQMAVQTLPEQMYTSRTGGSTGIPLKFYMSRTSYEWRNAITLRGYGWAGALLGERSFYLWSVPVETQSRVQQLKTWLDHTLARQQFFNSFRLSQSTLSECLTALNQARPQVLIGYTSMLEYLARYIKKHGGLHVKVQSVITAAEGVNQSQRELLREVFNAPVFASYGSREFKLIAMECDRGGLHVSADNLLVEVLRRGQPAGHGELGQVVITDLHNFGMPFIRYEIGDVASARLDTCPCGRGLPLLGEVHGRIPDTIQSPDGKLISGIFFPHLLKEFDWIEQFQVIQKELNRVQLKLVAPDRQAAERGLPQLRGQIISVLGKDVRLDLEFVSDIPRNATGKHRAVISEIPVRI